VFPFPRSIRSAHLISPYHYLLLRLTTSLSARAHHFDYIFRYCRCHPLSRCCFSRMCSQHDLARNPSLDSRHQFPTVNAFPSSPLRTGVITRLPGKSPSCRASPCYCATKVSQQTRMEPSIHRPQSHGQRSLGIYRSLPSINDYPELLRLPCG
jgi:hypothetical protein